MLIIEFSNNDLKNKFDEVNNTNQLLNQNLIATNTNFKETKEQMQSDFEKQEKELKETIEKQQSHIDELTQIKEEAEVSSDINDALKVMLLKYPSLENVKNVAENELSMVYPNKDNTIMTDMSKDYVSHIREEENGVSFLDKIKGIFN